MDFEGTKEEELEPDCLVPTTNAASLRRSRRRKSPLKLFTVKRRKKDSSASSLGGEIEGENTRADSVESPARMELVLPVEFLEKIARLEPNHSSTVQGFCRGSGDTKVEITTKKERHHIHLTLQGALCAFKQDQTHHWKCDVQSVVALPLDAETRSSPADTQADTRRCPAQLNVATDQDGAKPPTVSRRGRGRPRKVQGVAGAAEVHKGPSQHSQEIELPAQKDRGTVRRSGRKRTASVRVKTEQSSGEAEGKNNTEDGATEKEGIKVEDVRHRHEPISDSNTSNTKHEDDEDENDPLYTPDGSTSHASIAVRGSKKILPGTRGRPSKEGSAGKPSGRSIRKPMRTDYERSQHGIPVRVNCPYCQNQFSEFRHLVPHMRSEHGDCADLEESVQRLDEELDQKTMGSTKGVKVACPYCRCTRVYLRIRAHVLLCHPEEPDSKQALQRLRVVWVKLRQERERELKRTRYKTNPPTPKTFHCQYCQALLTSIGGLKKHEKFACAKNPDREQRFKCRYSSCPFATTSKEKFDAHSTKHKVFRPNMYRIFSGNKKNKKNAGVLKPRPPVIKSRVTCEHCQKTFSEFRHLVPHLRVKHADVPDIEGSILRMDETLAKRPMQRQGVMLVCPYCDCTRRFIQMNSHLVNCHGDKPDLEKAMADLKEEWSTVRHRYEGALKKERERQQGKDKSDSRQMCQFCGRNFSCRGSCRNHERYMCKENPNRIKLHCCTICNFRTSVHGDYKQHMVSHEGERAFLCHICGKDYKTRVGLIQHKKREHGLVFRVPLSWHKCTHCEKKFSDRGKMLRHMSRHTEERNVSCDSCGKMFKSAEAVRAHVNRMHLDKYRFHCTKCGHGVDQHKYLKRHECGRVRRVQATEVLIKDMQIKHTVHSSVFFQPPADILPAPTSGPLQVLPPGAQVITYEAVKSEDGLQQLIELPSGIPLTVDPSATTVSHVIVDTSVAPMPTTFDVEGHTGTDATMVEQVIESNMFPGSETDVQVEVEVPQESKETLELDIVTDVEGWAGGIQIPGEAYIIIGNQ